jgi:hypothetical protein
MNALRALIYLISRLNAAAIAIKVQKVLTIRVIAVVSSLVIYYKSPYIQIQAFTLIKYPS